jgi:mRNA interferase MazF
VIVSRDGFGRLPLRIIVPLTTWKDDFAAAPWHIAIDPSAANGLARRSSADTFQVRSVSCARLLRRIGALPAPVMREIGKGLDLCLGVSAQDRHGAD